MRKELSFWGAIALSLGIMAPTLAMSLNGIGPAGLVGASVPLAFLMTFAAVGLVAYSFVRLTQRFNHAGSVYALAGASIGPRAASSPASGCSASTWPSPSARSPPPGCSASPSSAHCWTGPTPPSVGCPCPC
jgi:amino acid transporter